MATSKRGYRRRVASVVGAVALFAFAWFLVNRLRAPARAVRVRSALVPETGTDDASPPQKTATALRVGTYNIAHGRGLTSSNWGGPRGARLRRIAHLLARQQLDVVVLNEVDFDATWSGRENQAALIAQEAGFPFWAEQRSYDLSLPFFAVRIGNALLSKFPIERAELVPFPSPSWFEALIAGKKNGLVCTITVPGVGPVRVLAVHLESRGERHRVAAVPAIEALRRNGDSPLVALGDFNSTPAGYPASSTDQEGHNAMTQLLTSGAFRSTLRAPPTTDDFTFSADRPRKTIDWILVPPNWSFAEYRVVHSRLSDHRPVIATIQFPASD